MRRALLLWLLPLLLSAQDSRSTVEGMVANAATGEPIRRATVTIRRMDAPRNTTGSTTYTVSTDTEGKYLFADVAPGTYLLLAERNGFAPAKINTSIKLERGQKSSGQLVLMTPHAVITGRVLDHEGEPVTGAEVQAMAISYAGGRRLSRIGGASTNDLGEYRMFGLPAGKFYLNATYRSSQLEAAGEEFAVTYYPRATDQESAVPVQVGAGAQLRNIDITLARIRTASIRGHVNCEIEGEKRSFSLMLLGSGASITRSGTVRPDGSFEVNRISPGRYNLAISATIDDKRYSAHTVVQVGGGDVNGVVIAVRAGGSVSGRLYVEDRPEEGLGGITVGLQGWQTGGVIFGPQPVAKAKSDGSFQLDDVQQDHFGFYANGLPPGYYIKAVSAGGVDVLASGLETGSGFATLHVVVSPKAGIVEGSVQDARSQPFAGATVVLVPDDRTRTTYFQKAGTDQNGRFTFRTVVPGGYRVFAWEEVEAYAWRDPDFLHVVESQSERVTVAEGSTQAVQLKLIPAH